MPEMTEARSNHTAADQKRVAIVTGASTGIGRLTAEHLASGGHTVYATMREATGRNDDARAELLALADRDGLELFVREIDVTDDESVASGVAEIAVAAGRIDVVVNNAGVMNIGITEAYTPEEVARQFDVNVLGAVRVNRAVLPFMRQQRSGLLIHVSSIVGRVVLPFAGVYSASKFALEALAESYRYELAGFDVDSVIVEPGPFGTRLFHNSPPNVDDPARLEAYGSVASAPSALIDGFEEFLASEAAPDPSVVAQAVGKLVDMEGRRPLRTVVGVDFGVTDLNNTVEPVQRGFLEALGLGAAA